MKKLASGKKLSDMHINFGQRILKGKFIKSMDCISYYYKTNYTKNLPIMHCRSFIQVEVTGYVQLLLAQLLIGYWCMTLGILNGMNQHCVYSRNNSGVHYATLGH